MGERTVLLITVLIGALGWLFTHVVERVSDSPTVEFVVTEGTRGAQKTFDIQLSNVTRATSFNAVRILILAPRGGQIIDVSVTPREPSFEGDTEPHVFGRSADITLERFNPGARFQILAVYTGEGRPTLRASATDVPIRFQERGLETFFAKNEVAILSVLAVLWLVMAGSIFVHWIVASRRPRQEPVTPPEKPK
jgi:hypothetical protein